MANLIVLYWRDIPSQVIVKAGRSSAKRQLSERFIRAIDAAAMHAGAKSDDAYLAEWRRGEPIPCGDDLETKPRAPPSGWRRNTIRIAWPSGQARWARRPALITLPRAPGAGAPGSEPLMSRAPIASCSRRPASEANLPTARACLRPRASLASILIRFAAGGAFAAAVRSMSPKATSPNTRFVQAPIM